MRYRPIGNLMFILAIFLGPFLPGDLLMPSGISLYSQQLEKKKDKPKEIDPGRPGGPRREGDKMEMAKGEKSMGPLKSISAEDGFMVRSRDDQCVALVLFQELEERIKYPTSLTDIILAVTPRA